MSMSVAGTSVVARWQHQLSKTPTRPSAISSVTYGISPELVLISKVRGFNTNTDDSSFWVPLVEVYDKDRDYSCHLRWT
jgi:hypothetical protein